MSEDEPVNDNTGNNTDQPLMEDDGLGGVKWECVAVTLNDLNGFSATIEKSRDPNEKMLRKRVIEDLQPLLEKQEEARRRKAAQKERELLNIEKLATAKRSSRIAGKLEQQRQEEEARETERKRQAELAMAKREREKWTKLERERDSRMMTREQRLREREARRILHEEELANLSDDSKKLESGQARLSERHLKAEIEKKKLALEELAVEDDWVFDCICGAYGQIDDGTHSISCEKCNIWQHTKCVGVSEVEADGDDFHFICKTCKRRTEETQRAKQRPMIKFKLNRPGSSSSAVSPHEMNGSPLGTPGQMANGSSTLAISPLKTNSPYQASLSRPAYDSPYGDKGFGSTLVKFSRAGTVMATEEGPQGLISSHINGSSPIHSQNPYMNGQNTSSAPSDRSPELQQPSIQQMQVANGHSVSSLPGLHSVPTDSHAYPQPPFQTTAGDQFGIQVDQRRRSVSLLFPLASAPVLSPYADKSPKIFSSSPSQNPQSTPTQQSSQKGLTQHSSPANIHQIQSPKSEPNHEYSLPLAVSGISPTKHSPPLPNTVGITSLCTATTSILPVAPLSPNPQQVDPTSPIKPTTPREVN